MHVVMQEQCFLMQRDVLVKNDVLKGQDASCKLICIYRFIKVLLQKSNHKQHNAHTVYISAITLALQLAPPLPIWAALAVKQAPGLGCWDAGYENTG